MNINDERPRSTKCYYKELSEFEHKFFVLDGELYLAIDYERNLVYNFNKEVVDHAYGNEVIQPVRVDITIKEDMLIER